MSGVFGNSWFLPSISFFSHTLDQSLRVNQADDPMLVHTHSASADDEGTCTISLWVKRGKLGSNTRFMGVSKGSNFGYFGFESDDKLAFFAGNPIVINFVTNRFFRDASAYYHIVVALDIDNSTSTERFKLYVNGVQETSFATATYPTSTNAYWNEPSAKHSVGCGLNSAGDHYQEFDGYIAEVNFIDGVVLDPTSFGETSEGVWIPKKYTGTYGAEGFHLTFKGTGTATTSAGTTAQNNIGDDQSGNGNNFEIIGSSIVSSDVVPDSPTNNFSTMNPLYHSSKQATLLEGNLKVDGAGFNNAAHNYGAVSTFAIPKNKKIYIEVECTDATGSSWYAGFATQSGLDSGTSSTSVGGASAVTLYNRAVYKNGTQFQYSSSDGLGGLGGGTSPLAAGDILGMAVDGSNGNVWFSKNGSYFKTIASNNGSTGNVGDPSAGSDPVATIDNVPAEDLFVVIGGSASAIFVNFGQDSTNVASANSDSNGIGTFEYAVPTDYVCLAASSLSDPTIGPSQNTQADDHFDILLWTGNGTAAGDAQEINGLQFRPDWVWTKGRGGPASNPNAGLQFHEWHDAVRGAGVRLFSNATSAESDKQTITSFDNDGFTVAMGTGGQSGTNQNLTTMVGWCWKAGGDSPTKTYKVRVVATDQGNRYQFRNSTDSATFDQSQVTLNLQEGGTYTFDVSHSTVNGHPMKFSTTSNGSHGGGTTYSTGVVYTLDGVAVSETDYVNNFNSATSRTVAITVAASAPTLYYFCHYHSAMGGQINTNSTFGSTNFDGTLLSVDTVNETAGFSMVSYSGNLSSSGTASFGHGLGKRPSLVITKSLNNAGVDSGNWLIWHDSLTTDNYTLRFDTQGELDKAGNGDMASLFTTTTFGTNYTVGSNVTGNNYIAYLFSEIEGFSKFGKFRGNSSGTDGAYVYVGFRPRLVIGKVITQTGRWWIYDSARSPRMNYSIGTGAYLTANSEAKEVGDNGVNAIQLLSNGFKMNTTNAEWNGSSHTYVYLAFAEVPQKFSNAR
tara:strand:- start:486 stop:3518 length:3033 start_codon:yes stop_codon:yes gene_type:complete